MNILVIATIFKTVTHYTGGLNENINHELRNDKKLVPHMKKKAEFLDAATQQNTTKGHTVYRGIPFHHSHFEEGKTYRTKGFTSTSTSKHTARQFTEGKGEDSTLLHMRLPKGFKYKDIEKSHATGENEHLLPRGTRYTVTHKIHNKGEPVHVFAEVHPEVQPSPLQERADVHTGHETKMAENATHVIHSLNTPDAKSAHGFSRETPTHLYEIKHKKSGKTSYVMVGKTNARHLNTYGEAVEKSPPQIVHQLRTLPDAARAKWAPKKEKQNA